MGGGAASAGARAPHRIVVLTFDVRLSRCHQTHGRLMAPLILLAPEVLQVLVMELALFSTAKVVFRHPPSAVCAPTTVAAQRNKLVARGRRWCI